MKQGSYVYNWQKFKQMNEINSNSMSLMKFLHFFSEMWHAMQLQIATDLVEIEMNGNFRTEGNVFI